MWHTAIFCEWLMDLMKALSLHHNTKYNEMKHLEVLRHSQTRVGTHKNPFKQPLADPGTNILNIWLSAMKVAEIGPFPSKTEENQSSEKFREC